MNRIKKAFSVFLAVCMTLMQMLWNGAFVMTAYADFIIPQPTRKFTVEIRLGDHMTNTPDLGSLVQEVEEGGFITDVMITPEDGYVFPGSVI